MPQLRGLILYGWRRVARPRGALLRRTGNAAPQHVELNFDTQQRLQNTVMQVARDTAALPFNGPRPQVPQQKDIFHRGTHMPRDALKPNQVLAPECPPAI